MFGVLKSCYNQCAEFYNSHKQAIHTVTATAVVGGTIFLAYRNQETLRTLLANTRDKIVKNFEDSIGLTALRKNMNELGQILSRIEVREPGFTLTQNGLVRTERGLFLPDR